ncbi:C2 NT-type domain-containing protein [Mycena venus]|uniref:C2 NT-type domain-containing protein n=1 Tax=Mycena venus TaxID=2733690 RepID=A0A8H7CB13_9AGAR|nr:C2 NT-type domain-containing protein [Mycena venus]
MLAAVGGVPDWGIHALFHVRITINQLASVPLVHGEFGVRWKFKNTHKVKGKGKATAGPEPEHDGDGDSFGSADSTEEPQTLQMPSSTASSSIMVSTDDAQTQTATSRAGQTGWLPLKDHSVTWDHPLSAVVQMSIERDTHRLLPHPFKLTVVQRVIAHDPDAPHNPRLGTVEIDLAEYVDSFPATAASKGVVTRRYLLRDSKTNATLRLSIHVEPVGTPPSFTAPPLPNGEILAGVATLLSTHDDVYRTRPRALDLYAPVESAAQSSKSSMKSKDPKSKGTSEVQPFDIRALPRAYGPRPTESLIEALFNPAPVREERLVSPFTRLITAESGSVSSFPSVTTLSKPYSASFISSTSSRPSTSASSRSVDISAENGSSSSGPITPPMSVAHSSSGHGSLAPSSRTSANGHAPRPSITSSISPSFVSTQGNSTPASSADGRTHHWWKRNRDRSRSRSQARTGPVAVV